MRKMAGYSLIIFFFLLILAIRLKTSTQSSASYAPSVKMAIKIPAIALTTFDIPTLTQIPTPTNTPTPTPTPLSAIATSVDLETLFSKYSDLYHADKNLLEKIAKCESGFNATSNNNGKYLGMFQFAELSWISARTEMGQDTNPGLRTSSEEAIKTAAYMVGNGRESAWPNCH